VMTRDNIGLCAILKTKASLYNRDQPLSLPPGENICDNPIVICNAHIHWDPEFCDVKLVQTMMLVNELWRLLEEIAKKYRYNSPLQIPLLICGDLNSLPKSGVFEYLAQGKIAFDHPDFKEFRVSDIGRQVLAKMSITGEDGLNNEQTYQHNLQLSSAYEESFMPFTNYTLDFKGMIDYMLTNPALQRLSVLAPIDHSWFSQNKIIGCPHPHVPSDHLPLVATYSLVPPMWVNTGGQAHYGSDKSNSYHQQMLNAQHHLQQYGTGQRSMSTTGGSAATQQTYRNLFSMAGFGQSPSVQLGGFGPAGANAFDR